MKMKIALYMIPVTLVSFCRSAPLQYDMDCEGVERKNLSFVSLINFTKITLTFMNLPSRCYFTANENFSTHMNDSINITVGEDVTFSHGNTNTASMSLNIVTPLTLTFAISNTSLDITDSNLTILSYDIVPNFMSRYFIYDVNDILQCTIEYDVYTSDEVTMYDSYTESNNGVGNGNNNGNNGNGNNGRGNNGNKIDGTESSTGNVSNNGTETMVGLQSSTENLETPNCTWYCNCSIDMPTMQPNTSHGCNCTNDKCENCWWNDCDGTLTKPDPRAWTRQGGGGDSGNSTDDVGNHITGNEVTGADYLTNGTTASTAVHDSSTKMAELTTRHDDYQTESNVLGQSRSDASDVYTGIADTTSDSVNSEDDSPFTTSVMILMVSTGALVLAFVIGCICAVAGLLSKPNKVNPE